MFEDKILDTISKNFFENAFIKKGDIVVVGLSGGMDSMCLIDALNKLSEEYCFKIVAIHIHHGIRGEEADKDLAFVEKYCKSMNIKLVKAYVDANGFAKKESLSLEEAARILRYREFDKAWKEFSKQYPKKEVYIAIAHHMKDQVETIIHNMVRGTGIKGLSGMKMINENIIRPLLYIGKDEIEEYVNKYDIPYVTDSTNDDEGYTRNYIRKEIVDILPRVNEKSYAHIAELSKQAVIIDDYFEKLSKYVLSKICLVKNKNQIVIDLNKFRNLHVIIKLNVIKRIFENLVDTLKDITKVNLNDIVDVASKEKGAHLDLPYNVTLDKKKNDLIFTRNEKNISMSKRKKK